MITAFLTLMLAPMAFAADAPGLRWTPEKANQWSSHQPWYCGFNYIPSNAINSTEMWARDTFDPTQIDKELAEAQKIGFNCARVFIQYIIWEQDPQGLHKRMDQFLTIADKHGIKILFVPFDDCWFGHQGGEPIFGKQPDPTPGEYASGFTSSPGPKRVGDPAYWPKLHDYVTDLLTWFKDDNRVFMWDLYNECMNGGMDKESLPLLRAEWEWARAVNPSQPLTMCYWASGSREMDELNKFIFENVDVVTFHNYSKGPDLKKEIALMKTHGRPVICTEWLNRPAGSVVAEELPIFADEQVGCIHWGLVNGKTQTNYRWGSKAGDPLPKVWQHDLFHTDLTPYDPRELQIFHDVIASQKR
jgi:hypothetical protein